MGTITSTENGTNFTSCATTPEDIICTLSFAFKTFSSVISILGCLLLLAYMLFYKLYKTPNQRILIYLIVNSILFSVAFALGYWYKPGTVCTIQAFFLQFISLMLMHWFIVITVNLYINIVFYKETKFWLEVVELVSCPIIPLITAIIPIIFDAYGPAGSWCWIDIDPGRDLEVRGNILRWALFYGFIIVIIVFLIVSYLFLALVLLYKTDKLCICKRARSYSVGETARLGVLIGIFQHSSWYFLLFPIVFIAVFIFPIINRTLNFIFPDETFGWLLVLQSLLNPMIGFLNVCVYMVDGTFRHNIKPSSIRDQYIMLKHKTVVREYPTN